MEEDVVSPRYVNLPHFPQSRCDQCLVDNDAPSKGRARHEAEQTVQQRWQSSLSVVCRRPSLKFILLLFAYNGSGL